MMADFLLNLLASLAYDLLKALPSRFQGQRYALGRNTPFIHSAIFALK